MKLEIRNRWSGAVQFTAEIEADESTNWRLKIGLALKWAVANSADLSDAVLSGADLSDAVLSGADLRGAVLSDADLRGADLRGADLRGADLSDADLRGAVLRGADLSDADLRGAVLSDADLRGADLRGAVLSGEKISRLLACASRVQFGYTFHLYEMQTGPAKIVAGCRFLTIADYRTHVAREYPDSDKASETLAILDYFEAVEGNSNKLAVEPMARETESAS